MKPVSDEIPYLLRVVALIFFFNGLFSFVHTLFSVLSPEGLFIDPRSLNILIALGLVSRKRFWYILGLLSAGANVGLHVLRLTEFAFTGTGTIIYFLTAIAIDTFQVFSLLRKNVRSLFFTATDSRTPG